MRICILGATGLVGRELLTLIDRAWPQAELSLFASRDQSIEHAGRTLAVAAADRLEQADAPRGDLAFVALDDEYSARYCPRLVALGYRVIDKSNTYRTDPAVPLVVAGVNHRRITPDTRLIANPNCTTIPLALTLEPLARRYGLGEVTVSTYQAISGAGLAPLDGFLAATAENFSRMQAEGERLGVSLDPTAYPGNTVPHNGKTDDSGFSAEERKLVFESRKILELELDISAQCCRVPVPVGHYENVWLTLREAAREDELAATLARAPFVHYVPGTSGEGLTALASLHARDAALVGRLRADNRDRTGTRWCLTVAGDNLRLGAATNAVRAAAMWFPGADADLRVG
ncbi:aspartate-semialdehyde dehydrogenase [Nannocystaceae bacterium ST9]